MIGDQAIEVNRGELANDKKHNVFNIRYVKKYLPFESQFYFVTPATLEDLRKNPSQISRIADVVKENGRNIFLVLIVYISCIEDNNEESFILLFVLEEYISLSISSSITFTPRLKKERYTK